MQSTELPAFCYSDCSHFDVQLFSTTKTAKHWLTLSVTRTVSGKKSGPSWRALLATLLTRSRWRSWRKSRRFLALHKNIHVVQIWTSSLSSDYSTTASFIVSISDTSQLSAVIGNRLLKSWMGCSWNCHFTINITSSHVSRIWICREAK